MKLNFKTIQYWKTKRNKYKVFLKKNPKKDLSQLSLTHSLSNGAKIKNRNKIKKNHETQYQKTLTLKDRTKKNAQPI